MLSCFLFFFKNCVKFTSSIFFVIIEQQLASLVEWLGSSCISDRAWVLNLVSAFFYFFLFKRHASTEVGPHSSCHRFYLEPGGPMGSRGSQNY